MSDIIEIDLDRQMPTDRVRAWKQALDDNFMGVECRNAGEDLRASVRGRQAENGIVCRGRYTRHTLARTPTLIRQATKDLMLVAFVRNGTHTIRQGAKTATLHDGGIYILDSLRPFEVDFASSQVTQAVLHVPRAALLRRVGAVEDIAFEPGEPLQKLLTTFALGMIDSVETLDSATLDALLGQTLDLFAMMVAQRKRNAVDPSTHRAGMLLRVKAYINAHLREDDLTLERTARAFGISSRYVNALLATQGTSFGRYVLAQRLERARREIIDPRHAHKQVTEVAFDWGFKDASHFGRTFKEKFGMPPRDAKRQEH